MTGLDDVDGLWLDGLTKGVPGGTAPFRLADIGSRNWNLLREDLPLPLAVLKRSALDHNSLWMQRYLELSGVRIAPHGKTTMSPQLFQRQLDDGAWAMTVATAQQIEVARRYGVKRIVLANQLIGRQAIRYVLDALQADPDFDFYCLVDSVDGVEMLHRAAEAHALGRPLQVLLEGGMPGGRTGARDLDAAMATARAVRDAAPHLALRGVEGFEGLIMAQPHETQADAVGGFLDFLVEIARACDREALYADGPVILSAGGSAFYDIVIGRFNAAGLSRETLVLTRSGCYLTHDSAMYRRFFEDLKQRAPEAAALGNGLQAALEVWAYVQSRPEPGKAILTMGKRDASEDADQPVPLLWYRPGEHDRPVTAPAGATVVGMNDQHAHMTVPEDAPYRVGDMVGFGISHPCTTFDKWDVMAVVDDDYNVVSAIKTFF